MILGSGTAALTGDLLAALAAPGSPTPVLVVRGPDLPAWVGAADLAIAVSASGRAPETLAATDEAIRRGVRLVTVAAEGSPLDLRGEQASAPHVAVPGGRSARASLWSMAVPVLLAADALELISVPPDAIEATAEVLVRFAERCRPSYESFLNPAKTFAVELAGGLPLIWGTPPVGGLAATRLAAQLTRNAKLPALPGVLPEALHTVLGCFDGVFGAGLPGRGRRPARGDVPRPGRGRGRRARGCGWCCCATTASCRRSLPGPTLRPSWRSSVASR